MFHTYKTEYETVDLTSDNSELGNWKKGSTDNNMERWLKNEKKMGKKILKERGGGNKCIGQEWVGVTRGEAEMDGKGDKSRECEGEGVGKKTQRSREQAWRLSPGKHGRLTDVSPRQPLTTHVALLGASTGSAGRPGKVGVCIREASGRQGERVQS